MCEFESSVVSQPVRRLWGRLARNWKGPPIVGFRALADDPEHSFPGQGQMKPEQSEIARLKREVAKLKAERDILKNCPGRLARLRAVETARAILAVGG